MNTNQHTPVNSSATVANNYLARSLRQLQSTTFLHCMEHSRKTINTSPPVYTGMTALRLAGIETPLCSRFEAVKFQVLYVGEPTKRSGRKDTSYLKCPPSLTGIAHLTWTHDNITIVYTHPLMTWALLAPYLTQIEVIVLADAILRASSGSMTVANISRFLDGADAFPGRRKCIDALVFLDAVTDSTMECRCTLVMLRHGLPQPVKHWKILIPELAHEATVDIAYPKQRVIIEYDGDAHRRDKRQYRWDERKRQALRAMGYTVIVVFADDILTSQGRRRFAQRVAKALDTTCRNRPHPKFRALLAENHLSEWITELLDESANLFDFVYVISHRFCLYYDTQAKITEKHSLTQDESLSLATIGRMTAEGELTMTDTEWQ